MQVKDNVRTKGQGFALPLGIEANADVKADWKAEFVLGAN